MAKKTAKKGDFLRTRADVGRRFETNERTVARWLTLEDFPKKLAKGWKTADVETFLEKRRLGPFRRGAHRANGDKGPTLTEANTLKTIEQVEIARIHKERAIIEHKKELGELVEIEEVVAFYKQTVATVTSVVEGFVAVKDRELPESVPSPEAWPELRDRILKLDARLLDDIAYAMREIEDYG